MKRSAYAARLIDVFGLALGFAAFLAVLYYWDPTRVLIKRLSPEADARFEQIPKDMAELTVADGLSLRSKDTVGEYRRRLSRRIFGMDSIPDDLMPQKVNRDVDKSPGAVKTCLSPTGPDVVHLLSRMDTIIMRGLGCEVRFYKGWRNLAGVDELTGHLMKHWRSYAIGYFRPIKANGHLILYQQGLAATYHDQHRLIEGWIADGYTVAAMNMPGYGDNTCYDLDRYCGGPIMAERFATELAVTFLPPVLAVNHALGQKPFRRISMVGISSGAWVTAVSAALDPRIDDSIPVAGVLPLAMLWGKETSARSIVEGINDIAGMLDLAVMAADRPGRRQLQIFNRFDRCCFFGPRPTLYAGLLSQSAGDLGGEVEVVFDETHARHKMSRWGLARVMAFITENAATSARGPGVKEGG